MQLFKQKWTNLNQKSYNNNIHIKTITCGNIPRLDYNNEDNYPKPPPRTLKYKLKAQREKVNFYNRCLNYFVNKKTDSNGNSKNTVNYFCGNILNSNFISNNSHLSTPSTTASSPLVVFGSGQKSKQTMLVDGNMAETNVNITSTCPTQTTPVDIVVVETAVNEISTNLISYYSTNFTNSIKSKFNSLINSQNVYKGYI